MKIARLGLRAVRTYQYVEYRSDISFDTIFAAPAID
jgi:hypothetical protein